MAVPKLRFKEFNQEWKNIVLEEVAQVERGKFSARPRNNPKYFNGNIPFVQTGDISNSDIFIEKYSQTLNELGLTVSKLFPPNTILITIAANIGDSAITKFSIACPDSIVGILVRENLSNVYFLKNILDLKKKTLDSQATQNAQKNINLQVLKPLEISIPTLDEQTKIANFLTAVDEKISQLNEQHQLMIQYKKGVMQKIFNQEIRFKDDNGEDFGEWQNIQIKDIFSVTRGQVLSVSQTLEYKDDIYQYPVYSSQTKNKGLLGYYSDYLYQDAITWTTDGANAGEVNFRKGKFYCTNVCGVLLSNKGYANNCVSEILNSIAKRHVSYVGNPKLMNNVMSEILINIPSDLREQTKISDFLTELDSKIENLASKLDLVKKWKKGLLQQMFV
ncbi:restriction endonuclease subunit S [uncultured Haemophilus sp.]|uniref:restriction endonuclease subunit S n=1 Tax=uncultured Haemophilus sp. TaxID=237779 RepID=UPI0025F2B809|nr:restriction endonuclease subunit S [uncultured Haemophilus sp.]